MKHGGNVWQGGYPDAWLDFSANLRPEGIPEWVEETLERAMKDARYYPDVGMKAAREGLAAYTGVGPERILPTPGGVAALELALRLEYGRVCVQAPTFGEYSERAHALGRDVTGNLDDCRPGDTAMICNPNNPTGGALDRDRVLEISENLRRRGAALVVDEAFIDYCPLRSVRGDVCSRFRVVGSLTKILCVPGVRLGYVCASADEIAAMEKLALPWALNAFAAAVAAELPRHMDDLRRYASENIARRERFAARLKEIGANPLPSEANFILCDFGRDMRKVTAHLKSNGILVRECASFGLDSSFLRLAVRTDEENDRLIEEIMQCPEY